MSNYKKDPITIEEFAFLQKTGRLYVGFVAGLGYAHVKTTAINPLNFNGYSHIGNLPLEANKFTLIKGQYINNDPEMVRKSLEKTVSRQVRLCTVKQGDTITLIAKRYGVSIESIVIWNQLPNQDKIDVGQKLIVSESLIITESDKKNSSNMKNPYYMIWGDWLNRASENPHNQHNWVSKSFILMTITHSINIFLIVLLVKMFIDYEIPFVDLDFGWKLGGAISFMINFGTVPIILNYFLIFHNKRYLKIMQRYPKQKRSVALIYHASILFGALVIACVYGLSTQQY